MKPAETLSAMLSKISIVGSLRLELVSLDGSVWYWPRESAFEIHTQWRERERAEIEHLRHVLQKSFGRHG